MNPTFQTVAGMLVAAAAAFIAGMLVGINKGYFNAALEENKVAAACLRANDVTLSPDFREYLKGRIYYNLASKFPNNRGYLLKDDWDFGPVDLGVLKRRLYAKDPVFHSESYAVATQHLSNAESTGANNPAFNKSRQK